MLIIRFANHMITENVQVFWSELQRGEFISDAAVSAGTYRKQGTRWVIANGGVRPRRGRGLKGRCLSFAERERIAMSHASGASVRAIAGDLARSPSTISRELRGRNRKKSLAAGTGPARRHAMAYHRASRPKPAKLAVNLALGARRSSRIWEKSTHRSRSPADLRVGSPPTTPEIGGVPPETIYQSIYVQSPRCSLRRDLAVCLRTGRALRRPEPQGRQRKNRIPNMINIAERPAEVEDRAVPGNWEGDLIIGKQNQTAIGTLVERQTGYAMLLHLPEGYKPEQVRDALAAKIQTLPDSLRCR